MSLQALRSNAQGFFVRGPVHRSPKALPLGTVPAPNAMPSPSLFDFLSDAESWRGMRQGLTDAANRGMVAGTLGAPVDMATQAANLGIAGVGYLGHKAGLLSTPPELLDSRNVPGSSEWIGQKMQNVGAVSANRNPVAEMGMGLLSPVAFKAAQKAGGLLAGAEMKAAENLAAPSTMPVRGQRGMIRVGKERIPETGPEINKLYDDLWKRAGLAGAKVEEGASNISGSRYMVFDRGDELPRVQVRLSNHADYHPNSFLEGDRFSVDPQSGNTYESALRWLGDQGVSMKPITSVKPPDWLPEKFHGVFDQGIEAIKAKGMAPAKAVKMGTYEKEVLLRELARLTGHE